MPSLFLRNEGSFSLIFDQGYDALQVASLGEEIERLNFAKFIASFDKLHEVAHLSRGIAGDVNDGLWAVGEELIEEGFATTCARRVYHHSGLVRRQGDICENGFGAACLETAVGDIVQVRIMSRFGHGRF